MKDVVLVTGGCQGFGKEIAGLLSNKYQVVILSRNKKELEKTSKELKCDMYVCDISDVKQVQSSVDYIKNKYGRLDILINNAAIWKTGELDSSSFNDIAEISLINIVGTMNMTKACIPLMKKENKGKIVNIISVDALEGKSERSLYVSTKWAQAGFTNSMRKELEKYNIAVIGIYPGLMNTSLFKNAGKEKDLSNAMDPKEAARIIEFTLSLDNIVLEQVVFRNLHF